VVRAREGGGKGGLAGGQGGVASHPGGGVAEGQGGGEVEQLRVDLAAERERVKVRPGSGGDRGCWEGMAIGRRECMHGMMMTVVVMGRMMVVMMMGKIMMMVMMTMMTILLAP
jgi:hypothetical protein